MARSSDADRTAAPDADVLSLKSIDKKDAVTQEIENLGSDEETLRNYPLLANKTPEELKALNKKLVRRLDCTSRKPPLVLHYMADEGLQGSFSPLSR